ncbi:MAG: hypothetical protein GX749_09260, partial [Ruminococcaceae bacterium]|nr:hypothetical protein [Oscillospiraceae bacterium]
MKRRLLVLIVCLLTAAILVQGIPQPVEATVNPTANGMVNFAYKALREKWGYIYGTY